MSWDAFHQYWTAAVQFAGDHDKAIVAFGTGVLALFTVILAVATVFLWRATRDLVVDARDKGERQLRAYVALVGGVVVHATGDNQPGYLVQIELKNSGTTPGYDFTTWIMPPEVQDFSALPFGAPRPESERTGKSIISPNTSAWINAFYVWKSDELAAVRSRKKGLFVWGGADYRDAFGEKRRFFFRIRISGPEDTPNRAGWALKPHPLGYEAD